jgi:two-component system, chemotaxis family, protein-glutamate methylesterase/glutaminase
MPASKIKVLIGDSSSFARLVMSDILSADPGIEVIDTASSGDELFDKTHKLRPDVVFIDTDIENNERFFTVKRIISECLVRVVVAGTEEKLDTKTMSEARGMGVSGFVIKPYHRLQPDLRTIGDEAIMKIKSAVSGSATLRITLSDREARQNGIRLKREHKIPSHIVVIGASTGGPQAIETIVRNIKKSFTGAVLIAQHMPSGFTRTFAERLDSIASVPVEEAEHGMLVEAGKVILAKGDHNMSVVPLMGMKDRFRVELSQDVSMYDRPSVDLLMRSAAEAYGADTIGIILSGMGNDGTLGVKAICEKGGFTIAQDEETSTIFGMARAAVESGYIHKVLTIDQVAHYINININSFALKV